MRSHFCGLVDESMIGQTVTLCGWADVARDLGGLCFIDLRDHEGIVQVVAEPSSDEGNAAVVAAAAKVGYEDCLRITGTVRARHAVNPAPPGVDELDVVGRAHRLAATDAQRDVRHERQFQLFAEEGVVGRDHCLMIDRVLGIARFRVKRVPACRR